jgi:ABC-type glycerol-3-phosphate transport system permease component
MANSAFLPAWEIGIPESREIAGPYGPKPRHMLSRRNIFLYGTLIVVAVYYLLPLYVMVVTSLKGMPEIRLGNIFSPPLEITFEPWVKAWSTACTGLNCDGLSRGFWNSVRITVPSVVLSIAIASVNGYALANWRFKGADFFFTILIVMMTTFRHIFVVDSFLQVNGIWNDFMFRFSYTKPDTYPMTVQLNNIVNSVQGVKEYNVNMAATLITGLVPLIVYFVSGKLFVRGIAAGAVKG